MPARGKNGDERSARSDVEAFDEAPTDLRSTPVPPADRAAQMRRLALLGMRIADVAHKMNNATGVILGYAHILGETPDESPVPRAAVVAIQRQAERCALLSRRVTELAMASTARSSRVPPDSLLQAALRFAAEEGDLRGRVTVVAPPALPPLSVRAHDVGVALGHIVLNALDATEAGGEVVLAALQTPRRGRDGIALTVTDSGEGIASEALGRIFEPFFTTRRESGHVGLGLAVARAIVDAEGGQIELESGRARGTTVRVWLPLPEDRAERPRAHSGTRVTRPR